MWSLMIMTTQAYENPAANLFENLCYHTNARNIDSIQRLFSSNTVITHVDTAKNAQNWTEAEANLQEEFKGFKSITMNMVYIENQGPFWATGICDIHGIRHDDTLTDWSGLQWTLIGEHDSQRIWKIGHIHWSLPITKSIEQASSIPTVAQLEEKTPVKVVINDDITNVFTGIMECANGDLEYNICFTIVNDGSKVVHTHWSVPDTWRLFPDTKEPDAGTILSAEQIIAAYTKAIEDKLATLHD